MSDLSRLLGDVYGTGPAEDTVAEPAPTAAVAPVVEAPSWADESLLDEAFADWVPGPPSDAPADERAALAEPDPDPVPAVPVPETLAEALPVEAEWFFDVPAEPVVAEPVEQVVVPDAEKAVVPWQRADDDLLPSKGRRRKK